MAKKKPSPWEAIKAAFIAGEAVHELAKRFAVTIAEILKRAKDEGWRRGGATVTTLPVVAVPRPAEPDPATRAEQEAAADVLREHRERTRQHRDTYDRLTAEFQGMMSHLISFMDADTVGKMKSGTPAEQVKLLIDLLKATGIKFSMFERLTLMLREIVTLERQVWGLDQQQDADGLPQWDELLDLVRKPSTMRPLPENVVDFERRLAEREE